MVNKFLLDPLANTVAVIVLLCMIASVIWVGYIFLTGRKPVSAGWYRWAIPVLSLLGLGVALYLSFVEVTNTEAICGPLGNCNSVQSSSYAKLFGVIPVGLLGAAGYITIFFAWIVGQAAPTKIRNVANLLMWIMAWFGVLFTIYLTFLEPFVIGATCMWCISSAIIITVLLWLTTPGALAILQSEESGEEDLLDEEPETA